MISIRMRDIFMDDALEEALTFLEGKRDSCGVDGMYLSELRTYWKMNLWKNYSWKKGLFRNDPKSFFPESMSL